MCSSRPENAWHEFPDFCSSRQFVAGCLVLTEPRNLGDVQMRNQMIKLVSFFVLVVLIQGCDQSTKSEDEISVDLKISQEILSIGDTLKGTFSVTNNTPEKKSFYFPTSCQFGWTLSLNGITLASTGTACFQIPTELHLLPAESKKFQIKYYLTDNEDNKLQPGNYDIEAFLINTEYKVKKNFQIK